MDPASRDVRSRIALEREIHVALGRLPLVRAPHSLAPRVMRAVRAGSAGWRAWPLEWQLLSLVGAGSLVIACGVGLPVAQSWLSNLTAARAAAALWHTFLAPVAAPVVILTTVMCTASALIVAALKHLAWEGREISQ